MQVNSLYTMYMYSNLYISFPLHKTVILLFSYLVRSGILNNKFIYNNNLVDLRAWFIEGMGIFYH